MEKEFRFHLEMETERLVREQGLDPQEARRRALVAFGGVEKHKEALRDGRGLAWLGGLSLDLKLGARMLAKYPGLACVGVVGIAVAVAVGAVSFGVIYTVIGGTLPLPEGDRIVAIRNFDAEESDDARATHLHDLAVWRDAVPAIAELGAYRTLDRNLITSEGRAEPVRVVDMSASGFRIARVAPRLGRHLDVADERDDAPPVVVIGHEVWQNRFGGQQDIVGRTLWLGATPHVVIGVMPEGFAFPVNNRVWTPLRLDAADFAPGAAPQLDVFGRLAPDATLQEARTQLEMAAGRLAAAHPATHEHVRPIVLPYARSFIDAPQVAWALHLVQLLVTLLLVVIATNVAILVYARTATRSGEIAVRTALGASRRRIVAQLFAEALVLSSLAAAVGLVAAHVALRYVNALAARSGGEQLPFWMRFALSPRLVLYVAGLAVVGAVIVGVLPALRVTRRRMQVGLQQLGTSGSGVGLGRTWTVLVVAQVAVAVAVLPVTMHGVAQWIGHSAQQAGFATDEFLVATLHLDREGIGSTEAGTFTDDAAVRYAQLHTELRRRLAAEPSVAEVAIASAAPGDEPSVRLEVEGASTAVESAGAAAGVVRVGAGYFAAFDVPLLAGRAFELGDAEPEATAVIVNQSFVRKLLGDGAALGRRVRPLADRGADGDADAAAWYEIVGVVPDFPTTMDPGALQPRLYQPLAAEDVAPATRRTVLRKTLARARPLVPEAARPMTLLVRVRGMEPAAFTGRLRALTTAVDPMLRLGGIGTLAAALDADLAPNRLVLVTVTLLTLSVVLLSAAGIYALVSFTITRRRREIGIRSALGAGPRRVLGGVLARVLGQIGLGIGLGVLVAALLDRATGGDMLGGRGVLLLPAVAMLMIVVGAAAATGPARRALRIQPTEALRADV